MLLPAVTKASNVVNVFLYIRNAGEDLLNHFLSNVGRLIDTHWQAQVSIQSEGRRNSTFLAAFLVQLRVEHHGDIQLCKELVFLSPGKQLMEGKGFALNDFI
jgi:hypothetical protein